MAQIVFEFPPDVFSALRKAPEEFASEMRIAAAIHWYSQEQISQGKAAEIRGQKERKAAVHDRPEPKPKGLCQGGLKGSPGSPG